MRRPIARGSSMRTRLPRQGKAGTSPERTGSGGPGAPQDRRYARIPGSGRPRCRMHVGCIRPGAGVGRSVPRGRWGIITAAPLASGQAVRRLTLDQEIEGSNPSSPASNPMCVDRRPSRGRAARPWSSARTDTARMPGPAFTPSRQRVTALRMVAQHIGGEELSRPLEVVRRMLALQAQDFPGVKWSVGIRQTGATEVAVETACDAGEIVRSWPLRGTLHLVAGEDLAWLLALTAPRATASAAGRRASLGIAEAGR